MLLAAIAAICTNEASGQHASLDIASSPALIPAFSTRVPDYVVRCRAVRGVQLSVTAPTGDTVAVDGHQARTGSFRTDVSLSNGQAFPLIVNTGGRRLTDSVRCLPGDFPGWTATRPGRPQAAYYVLAPCCHGRYATIFDNHGVPIWWLHTRHYILDASLLPDGDVAVGTESGGQFGEGLSIAKFNEYRLDGQYVRTFSIPGGIPTDRHELQIMPNGDYVVAAHVARSGVNLRPYGGPAHATVLDALIAEVSPQGKLVWSWSSKGHIRLAETGRWFKGLILSHPARLADGRKAYDIVHINAIARYPRGFLVSMRHTDAIYAIDKRTGDIMWKLGGTHTSKSLKIIGDDVPDFGGQHDVSVLPDGTVSLFDNGTGRNRPARVLRFRIDARARTATLVQELVDHQTGYSPCCGSARWLPGGDWVVSWGGTHVVTELTPDDQPVLTLDFPHFTSYRAPPVLPGVLSRAALNAAMDRLHPRRGPH